MSSRSWTFISVLPVIESQQEYDDMLEELIDRFGEPPKAVLNLLAIARLKALAHQGYVTEIKQPKFLFAPVGDIVQALTVFAKELMELAEEEGKSEKQ